AEASAKPAAKAPAKAGTVKDPVCGMDVDPASDRVLKTEHQGKTYYFCSAMCKKNFEANPAKYLPKKEAPGKVALAKDPVCGMDVDPNSDRVLKTEHQGKTYYFCSEMCKKNFEANPGRYLPKKGAPAQASASVKAGTVKDLVCGMDVDPDSDRTLKTEYQGKTYYFCTEMCRERFDANPEKYVHAMAEGDMHGMHTHE
ncbi:MAG: YHS domain-containing protein, partial [Acidobacteria bacterium]|nr:YHS domain-containing protein [Acidobacteriota bacterium]